MFRQQCLNFLNTNTQNSNDLKRGSIPITKPDIFFFITIFFLQIDHSKYVPHLSNHDFIESYQTFLRMCHFYL